MKFNNTLALNGEFRSFVRQTFAEKSPQEAYEALVAALGPLPSINWQFNDSWGIIRARVINEAKEDISRLAAFGTPPGHLTPEGRANLIGQPVFYGTFDARTAMQEIKVPKGTECMVSIWAFRERPAFVSTFLRRAESNNDLYPLDAKLRNSIPKNLLDTYSRSSFKQAMKLRSSIFLQNDYSLSARLAHHAIYDKAFESDGIMYPSVIDPYRNNVALHPGYVTAHLHCVRIYKMVWNGAFIFRMLARGTPQRNESVFWEQTGHFDLDEIDRKYSGSNGPNEIHPNALEVLKED